MGSPRPLKVTKKAFELLEKRMGGPNITIALIATGGWKEFKSQSITEREKQLREMWKPLVERGVGVLRFHPTPDTVSAIVNPIIANADAEFGTTQRAVWKGKERKLDDQFMEDPRNTDIVIPCVHSV